MDMPSTKQQIKAIIDNRNNIKESFKEAFFKTADSNLKIPDKNNRLSMYNLTQKEKEIADLLLEGLTNKDLQVNLFIWFKLIKSILNSLEKSYFNK